MTFLGIPNERERRRAHKEATDALEKHGEQAAAMLMTKARQARSPQRRAVYRFARKISLEGNGAV